MNLTLRPGKPEDAPACGKIIYEAFKKIAEDHNFPPDIPAVEMGIGLATYLLTSPGIYSVVAELDGRVAGSNFMTVYDPIAGIGPITVDPSAQNAQLGKRMMVDAIEHARAQGFRGVRLVQSAYHGRSLSLYAKLGFVVREPLACMQGRAIGEQISGISVRAAAMSDLDACNALCVHVHGHNRGAELAHAIEQGSARVAERGGRIIGYAASVGFFGHIVGESNDAVKALIGTAAEIQGPGMLVPMRNAELFRWCLERGLRMVQPMTLMSFGLYNEPQGAFLPSILF